MRIVGSVIRLQSDNKLDKVDMDDYYYSAFDDFERSLYAENGWNAKSPNQ